MSAIHDLLIRGAEIVDGTGAPRFEGDVAVDDGRIVRVGARGRAEVDARGLVLAPGFIDAHTHDDRAMLSDGAMAPKVSQGVTTVIAGNCGISLAPRPPRVVPPLDLLDGDGGWFRYERYGDYLQALREQPAATNCAMLLGHCAWPRCLTWNARLRRPRSPSCARAGGRGAGGRRHRRVHRAGLRAVARRQHAGSDRGLPAAARTAASSPRTCATRATW